MIYSAGSRHDRSHAGQMAFCPTARPWAAWSGHSCRGGRRQTPAQRTFPGAAAAAALGRDELPAQLGQASLQQPQVVSRGLVLLRPGHLKKHEPRTHRREGSAGRTAPGLPRWAPEPAGPCHRLTERHRGQGPFPAREAAGALPRPRSPRSWPACRSWWR